ncbi:MAG: hypothetical protein IPN07_16470 [Dehalococcoidia bacterium]|nr:hypothetical protein [Dehalococcoidia bacterium]
MLGIAAVAAVTAVTANHRVAGWVETHPEVNQAWVDQLLATYPELPEGGGLFVSKTPPTLNVLDAYILQPMVNYLYEGETHPVYWIQDQCHRLRTLGDEAGRPLVYFRAGLTGTKIRSSGPSDARTSCTSSAAIRRAVTLG